MWMYRCEKYHITEHKKYVHLLYSESNGESKHAASDF